MTASVCYVEKHFSKGVYIMQSLFGAVTMLLLSLSLGMGWRAFVLVGVSILTALAGYQKDFAYTIFRRTTVGGDIPQEVFNKPCRAFELRLDRPRQKRRSSGNACGKKLRPLVCSLRGCSDSFHSAEYFQPS